MMKIKNNPRQQKKQSLEGKADVADDDDDDDDDFLSEAGRHMKPYLVFLKQSISNQQHNNCIQ